jgi:predicted dehydrogenase
VEVAAMRDVQLVTLDPGHFHAALVQKEMPNGVAPRVHVYAPVGPDVVAHLGRIAGFNGRAARPTRWEAEVHTGPDFLRRFLDEKAGNVVILSGRNSVKIDYLEAAIQAGLNVLADKPWVIRTADLPRLEAVLNAADLRGLVAYDIMTERYEVTSILQRELVNDREVFGEPIPGSDAEPGAFMESVHYLSKTVAGAPLRRPPWFFDSTVQGEGLTDVGTHLVDLVQWILLPGQSVNFKSDLQIQAARRWPTVLTRDDFQRVTGEAEFPPFLKEHLNRGNLDYFCNTMVSYTLRGVHVRLNVLWDFEAPPGAGDTHLAVFRGTHSWVAVRQEKEQEFKPELYVSPSAGHKAAVVDALARRVEQLEARWPGVAVKDQGERLWVTVPDEYRVGHEAHFGEVAGQFFQYLEDPKLLPAWEKPNMLAKYWLTTQGVEWARAKA